MLHFASPEVAGRPDVAGDCPAPVLWPEDPAAPQIVELGAQFAAAAAREAVLKAAEQVALVLAEFTAAGQLALGSDGVLYETIGVSDSRVVLRNGVAFTTDADPSADIHIGPASDRHAFGRASAADAIAFLAEVLEVPVGSTPCSRNPATRRLLQTDGRKPVEA